MGLPRGFTLIEVLVAAIILSVGLLGVAALQLNAMRGNQIAHLRTAAIVAAEDLVDRVLTNREAAAAGYYHTTGSGTTYPPTANADCGTTTGCTPRHMASNDVHAWQQHLASILPEGTGSICVDGNGSNACDGDTETNPVTHVIRISWTERGAADDTHAFEFVVRVY